MKHLPWLSLCLLLTSIGCDRREENGAPCDLDSDCGEGSWCDAVTKLCSPTECADGFCDLPDGYSTQQTTADRSNPELEALEEEVETLKQEVADLQAGVGTQECQPYKDANLEAWRITTFSLGTSAIEGHGFNMDNDAATCFPEENESSGFLPCEQGIDNAIAGLAKLVNPILEENVPPVALAYSPECDMLLFPEEEINATLLTPISEESDNRLTGVSVTEESITATEEGEWIVLIPLPFGDGSILRVKATEVRITASWNSETNEWEGLIGGWASKAALEIALSDFTTDDLDGTPPETALAIVMQLADRDTDGDGENDEVSMGLRFTASPIDTQEQSAEASE